MKTNRYLALTFLFSAGLLSMPARAQAFQVTNPLIAQRADPDIYRHSDGYYYFTATVPAYDRLELRRATALQGLNSAGPKVIWRAHSSGEMANHIWAPELHPIDGKWFIYFAAGSSSNMWDIRVYVLENASANPLEGSWTERGQLVTKGRSNGTFFALDATTFEHNGVRYLVWAEADPSLDVNSVLYIAPMSNPWTLSAEGVRISAPEYDWETVRYKVNEGPAVLKRNGKIFIAYSAAGTGQEYCMGLLTASDTSDLLAAASWKKSATPVFQSANGIYGPGHNQFTTSPDGAIDLLVYHARDYKDIVGDPLNDPNRATRVQPLGWNNDGTPDFGSPRPDGTLTIGTEAPDGGVADAAVGGDAGDLDASAGPDLGAGGNGNPGPEDSSFQPDQAAAAGHSGGGTGGSSVSPAQGGGGSGNTDFADSAVKPDHATGGGSAGGNLAGSSGTDGGGSTEVSGGGCGCRMSAKGRPSAAQAVLGLALALGLLRRKREN